MIQARKKLGLSQKALAEVAGVRAESVQRLEAFRYAEIRRKVHAVAEAVANVLELPIDKVLPPGSEGVSVDSDRIAVEDVEMTMLPQKTSVPLLGAGIEEAERSEAIRRSMSLLKERERRVLVLRFGLEGERPMLYEEIARELGISIERVRQIELRAIRKLQHPIATRVLSQVRD